MLDLAQAIVEAIAQKKAAALATVIDVTGDLPVRPGDKVLFLSTGERVGALAWEPMERALAERVATAVGDGSSRLVTLAFPQEEARQGGLETGGSVVISSSRFSYRVLLS